MPRPGAPCKHGFPFITQCPECTPPLEKEVEKECDNLMKALGWTVIRFSQPRHTMQTYGIPDRRYYPPPSPKAEYWLNAGPQPFWFECKRKGAKQRKEQIEFQALCKTVSEGYVFGGLPELAQHLRDQGIAEVGIR